MTVGQLLGYPHINQYGGGEVLGIGHIKCYGAPLVLGYHLSK